MKPGNLRNSARCQILRMWITVKMRKMEITLRLSMRSRRSFYAKAVCGSGIVSRPIRGRVRYL